MMNEKIIEHLTYDTTGFSNDDGKTGLTIIWGRENEKLEEEMQNDIYPNLESPRYNYMWIEKIKEMSNWVRGEKIFILRKHKTEGWFNCWFSKNKEDIGMFPDIIVDDKGYVNTAYFNLYTWDEDKENDIHKRFMVRPSCIYNDLVCTKLRAEF